MHIQHNNKTQTIESSTVLRHSSTAAGSYPCTSTAWPSTCLHKMVLILFTMCTPCLLMMLTIVKCMKFMVIQTVCNVYNFNFKLLQCSVIWFWSSILVGNCSHFLFRGWRQRKNKIEIIRLRWIDCINDRWQCNSEWESFFEELSIVSQICDMTGVYKFIFS